MKRSIILNRLLLAGIVTAAAAAAASSSSPAQAADIRTAERRGKRIMKHFGGPTWQARDGSTVVGQRVDGVTVNATAIPWLLLSAASTSTGPWGDLLVDTSFIQRVATTGGLAPAAVKCKATTTGAVVEVPYTADYYFWKPRGR